MSLNFHKTFRFQKPASCLRPYLSAAWLVLLLFLGFLFSWSYNAFFSENARFEAFAEKLFQTEVSQNTLNLHYSLADPQKLGISPTQATLGTLALDNTAAVTQCKDYEEKLKNFSYSDLSRDNRLTLDMLLLSYHTQASLGDQYLLEEPLGPSLGIQAQLPVLLAEYAFYKEQDITDYLNLLTSIEPYFQSILDFEQAKSDQGFFMCDETVSRIQEQCRAFLTSADSNYMQELFEQKIENFPGFSPKEQTLLKKRHSQLLTEVVFPAYQKLIQGLEQLRHTGKNSGGLSNFTGGKEYYQYLLKSQVGIYLPVEKLEQRLSSQLSRDSAEISSLIKASPDLLSDTGENIDLPSMSPEDIMQILQKKMQDDFPFTDPVSYEIRSVHKSMEEFLSPAFYLTPPLDTQNPNTIYINHGQSISNLELFTTLAHEGFPGHLYQTIYFARSTPSRIRYLLSVSGYVEGWATYIESYAYSYAADLLPQDSASDRTHLAWLNRSVNLCIYSLLDVGIHYHSWTSGQAAQFLSLFGIRDASVVSEIYRYITETPANYLKYYVGYLTFLDLREEQEALKGSDFDLKDFHHNVLSIGPVPFPVLKKYLL